MRHPVASCRGDEAEIEKGAPANPSRNSVMTPVPALALSLVLQMGAMGAIEPAIAANLTVQGRGTAAELQSILEQRGAKLPALTSSPNERKVDIEAKGGSSRELIRELRRQNQEIKELKAELQGVEPKMRPSSLASGVVAPSVPESQYTATNTAAAGTPAKESDSSVLSVFNILGIFTAAGLGGYVTLQKKDAEAVQAAYESKILAEQGIVQELQNDLGSIKGLLDDEKALVDKIKRESATASSEYVRQLSLEKASKEAVEKEKRLVEKSLSSEQRLAEALRLEAEKTGELLDAEKAAKFAADAEAAQLKIQLADVQKALEVEKLQVQKWRSDTQEANRRLSEARSVNEDLEKENLALETDLGERTARISQLNAAAAALQDQIDNATAVNASQSDLIERIGRETLNMQEAMSVMRSQAAERALAAHNEREAARVERERLEVEANVFREQIAGEQDTIKRLESEISAAKAAIQRANVELEATKQELVNAKESMASMDQEIQALNAKIYAAEKALTEERGVSSAMQADNVNLRSELAALQSDLSSVMSNLATERAEKQQLLDAIDQMKDEYNQMSERVESEQNTVASLRKEAVELKKTISDLETKNRTLGSNIRQIEEQSRAKLADVEARLLAAEKSSGSALSSRDDAVAAIDKLENVIKMLQEDMAESESFALAAQAELESERLARSTAESELEVMQTELRNIALAEESARAEVADQLEELRSEYSLAMDKLKELTEQQKAAPRRRAAAPKKELTDEEKEEKKRAAVEKRRATMARKKAEKEAAEKEAAEKEAAERKAGKVEASP